MNKDLGKRLIVSMIGLMVLVSTIFFTGTKAVYSAEAPSNTKFASDSDLMNSYDLDSGSSLNTQQVFWTRWKWKIAEMVYLWNGYGNYR